jgi:hypothetical protein
MNFSDNGLLFVNSIEYWFFILVNQVVRVPNVLELLFISESQVISEVFFQVVDQEVVLLWLEKTVVILVQNYDLFAQIV